MDQNPTLNGVLPSTWESLCFFGFLEDVVFLFKMFLSICSMRNPLRLDGIFCDFYFFWFRISTSRSEETGESADRASRLHNHCCVAWDRSTGDVVGNGSDHPNR